MIEVLREIEKEDPTTNIVVFSRVYARSQDPYGRTSLHRPLFERVLCYLFRTEISQADDVQFSHLGTDAENHTKSFSARLDHVTGTNTQDSSRDSGLVIFDNWRDDHTPVEKADVVILMEPPASLDAYRGEWRRYL